MIQNIFQTPCAGAILKIRRFHSPTAWKDI
jgi:hypothetical protein